MDEAVQTQPAQVICCAAGRPGVGVSPEEPGEVDAQVAVGEPVGV